MRQKWPKTLQFILFLLCLTGSSYAGGGPFNTLILVNNNDPDSLEVGRYYADQRGIPDAQILHFDLPVASFIDGATFTNTLQRPLLSYLSDAGLDGQISTLVCTWFTPTRVRVSTNEANSLSSALYYGLNASPSTPPCDLNDHAVNPYWQTETTLAPNHPDSLHICSVLTSDSLAQTKGLIDRSVSADYTRPSGNAYYLRTSDNNRNVRWPEFDETVFLNRQHSDRVTQHWIDSDFISGESNVVAYLTGDQIIPEITNNHYVAGALADHMTSFGGLLSPFPSQMSIKEWIHAGCVGSYGTVSEPCAFTNKFPEAVTHFYYARGFSMGESYMMGLQHPYQGLLLGDPLCKPFATPVQVQVTGVQSGETRSGLVALDIRASSEAPDHWIQRLDLFVDGRFFTTVTNVAPTTGNIVTATVNGNTRSYTVGNNDTLEDVVQGLRSRLNQLPNIQSTAVAKSDRIVLTQDARGVAGAGIAYSASAAIGSAPQQTVHAFTANGNYLESTSKARQSLTLSGTVQIGSRISAEITRPDGQPFFHQVIAEPGDTRVNLIADLQVAIRNDVNLQGPDGCDAVYRVDFPAVNLTEFQLIARSEGWNGANLEVDFDVIGAQLDHTNYDGPFASNDHTISARGQIYLSAGRPKLSSPYALDTTLLSDGPHVLSVVAYEGTAVATQGHTNIPFVVDNHALDVQVVFPEHQRSFTQGQIINALIEAEAPGASVTSLLLFAEDKALPAGPIVIPARSPGTTRALIDTAEYAPGPLSLHAEATDSSGRVTRSDAVTIMILRDADRDQLDDAWEQVHYGNIASYNDTDDPDNDQRNNYYEYITDTHPTNATSFFEFSIDATHLHFYASSNRWYQIEANDSPGLSSNAWQNFYQTNFTGRSSVTNVPVLPTTNELNRFRARVIRP